MKKTVLLQVRLMLIMVIISFISVQTEGRDHTQHITQDGWISNVDMLQVTDLSNTDPAGFHDVFGTQEPEAVLDSTQEPEQELTKEELKALKKAARKEKRALARAERQANRKVIDNPNHADVVILGEDLPTGRGVLDAISGRVPGMMISGDGYVVTRGPSSFYGGGTPLFLVDEIEVSRDYANSLPIEDIERVEVFTGPSSAIYGSRAGVGVISIYTRSSVNKVRLEE